MMLQFLKKIFFFVIIFVVYNILTFQINSFLAHKNHLKIENPNILIVGDSHTQRGINPKYFYSANNISQATEPYFLSFWKIKKYLNYNSVDTIILGCSHHNFSRFNDYKLVKEYF